MRLVGAGGAALALGCGDQDSTDLAVAVLEPSSDALMVSVWARREREATIEVRGGGLERTHVVPLAASGIGAFDVAGLSPGAAHELTVRAGELRAGPYRARTAPSDGDGSPIRIAVTADIDPSPEFDSDLIPQLVAAAPDLLVTLGDFPYTDNGPPASDVASYRERHVEVRTLGRVPALLRAMPVRAIYDDHEVINDWDARRAAADPARYAAGVAVWDEFFPLRDAAGEVRYRSWRYGAHAECFLLDCRRFRSPNTDPDGPAKTMLGAEQRAWLTGAVARSTATFKLVFTSVPLDHGLGEDHWRGFRTERQALFDALLGIPGVVFVSGDQHSFGAYRHAHGIREFQVGPLARGVLEPAPAGPGVLFRGLEYNAGILDIDGDRLTVAGLGAGGVRFYEETLTAAELTPRRG
jgi:alkaline phosphatase D